MMVCWYPLGESELSVRIYLRSTLEQTGDNYSLSEKNNYEPGQRDLTSDDSAEIVRIWVQWLDSNLGFLARFREHHGESIWSQGLNIEWSLEGFEVQAVWYGIDLFVNEN